MSASDLIVDPELFRTGPGGVHLVASRCPECSTITFPIATICPTCQLSPLDTIELSRHGVVYAVTIVRIQPPEYAGPVPYGLGLVELPEGVRIFSVILADDLELVRVGVDVECSTFGLATDPPGTSFAFIPRSQ